MGLIPYIICAVGSYILGSINPAHFIAKRKGFEIRSLGSRNSGATNAQITMGWGWGILVAILDIGKSALAVRLAMLIFPDAAYIGEFSGLCCILGHIFPFYLRFKGGKGFASFSGIILAMDWRVFLVFFVIAVIISLITMRTKYMVFSTMVTVIGYPAYMLITQKSNISVLIVLAATTVIIIKHRENLVRLVKSEEYLGSY